MHLYIYTRNISVFSEYIIIIIIAGGIHIFHTMLAYPIKVNKYVFIIVSISLTD